MAGTLGRVGTILIVFEDTNFRAVLSLKLRQQGYLVLDAQDAAEALQTAVRHSRRIDLLLTDDSDQARAMAASLKPYRPEMHVIHISRDLEPSSILPEVFAVLERPCPLLGDKQPVANMKVALDAMRRAFEDYLEALKKRGKSEHEKKREK